MFGVYDHINNNQMWTHSYKQKTGKQFLDFIKRVDQKYNNGNIKQIFLILDNASIHKSNKVKEILSRHHQRIHLVFLPITRSPDLNLIEVRWMCGCIDNINNTTFENEQDVGKAVSGWTINYNKRHASKTSTISLQEESIHVFT